MLIKPTVITHIIDLSLFLNIVIDLEIELYPRYTF